MKKYSFIPVIVLLFLGCIGEETKLQNVESCEVNIDQGNWDEDTEYDGLLISIVLKDKDGYPVLFKDVEITVDITIKSEDIEIYEGIFRIDNWEDKIQIPYEKLIAKVEKGEAEVQVRLPDNRKLETEKEFQI
ncbi:MAG: hypothetical protein J7L10_01875 [Methanomicrobia archaeon]|nr:hypothetical protein [Methanomicrobia archaeon]RLF94874.1 MAG: hypothetical protein DRN45_02400 [Thermococci archaeon]RLG01563.1 MAG: hypothetical protein DRN58_01525 [Thermococci archaeon]